MPGAKESLVILAVGAAAAFIWVQRFGDPLAPRVPPTPSALAVSTIPPNPPSLIADLPRDRTADYHIQQFAYASALRGVPQWRLEAQEAFLYTAQKIVHARGIKADLYDPEGKITHVRASEAKYLMNQRNLELYGGVQTTMPDGFLLRSEYLQYLPLDHHLEIPPAMEVEGRTHEGSRDLQFKCKGLSFNQRDGRVELQQRVHFTLLAPATDGLPHRTVLEADHCRIQRTEQTATFTTSHRINPPTFVRLHQPGLFARAKRMVLHYGDTPRALHYLIATDNVLIQETNQPTHAPQRYATGGRAEFDVRADVITLSELPQAYQNLDTVTGERMILHRKTDVIEVEQSNSYSEGWK